MNPRCRGVHPLGDAEHLAPAMIKENVMEKIFPKNEATLDRALRVVVGLVGIALVFVGPATPWGWIGLVPLVTGLVGSCPIYTVLGIGTCPVKKANA